MAGSEQVGPVDKLPWPPFRWLEWEAPGIENKVAKGTKRFECFCLGQLLESQVVNKLNQYYNYAVTKLSPIYNPVSETVGRQLKYMTVVF